MLDNWMYVVTARNRWMRPGDAWHTSVTLAREAMDRTVLTRRQMMEITEARARVQLGGYIRSERQEQAPLLAEGHLSLKPSLLAHLQQQLGVASEAEVWQRIGAHWWDVTHLESLWIAPDGASIDLLEGGTTVLSPAPAPPLPFLEEK